MKKLNAKEVQKFTKKYLSDWIGDVNEVSLIKHNFVKEYLVNNHYLVIVKLFKVIEKDLQEYC